MNFSAGSHVTQYVKTKPDRPVRGRNTRDLARAGGAAAAGLMLGIVLGLAACGGSGETVEIIHPPPGAVIALPFEVTIDTSVPLGSPGDGLHHVHIWFGDDESSYLVVESSIVEIASAPIGETQMHVSLRNADHSTADAETSISLVINAAPGG